ncbi:MAG TPA: hypothetical protein VK179_06030 [Bacteroidales bacterium]|nr:hypothetical protein [Bacteroidales bacterium]
MVHKLKFYLPAALLILSVFKGMAADTIRINITNKHILNAEGKTTGYTTIKQQFISPDDVFFREVNYDDKTGQISNYVFRFFKDHKLFSEECYNSHDSLLYIIKHSYSPDGNEILLEKLIPGKNHSLVLQEKTVTGFDKNKRIISEKKYFGTSAGSLSRYNYDANGLLIKRKDTYKPAANASVKQESKQYSYNDDHTIKQVIISGTDNAGKKYSAHEDYTYLNNVQSTVKNIGADGKATGEKTYKYLESGAPSVYEERDATGKVVLLLEYDYRKHYMETGTQKSFYESF